MSKGKDKSSLIQNKSLSKKSLPYFSFVLVLVLIPLFVFAITTGVLTVTGEADFEKDIRVDGVIIGTSHIEILQGVDFLDAGFLRRFSNYIQLSDQTLARQIPDDLNGIFVFENATTLTPNNISWIFWNSISKRPSFVIQDGLVGRASIFERSLIIGKEKGIADLNSNYNICPPTLLADCDTPATGADLLVEDDVEAFGSIQAHENLIVDGNSFITLIYGSMFQEENGNTIVLPNTTDFILVDDMNFGLTNGFIFDNNSHLQATEAGVYIVTWSLSFDDLASRSFEAGVTVDSVVQVNTLAQVRTNNANDQTNFAGTGIISVDVNELVALEIRAITTSSNVTIEEANITFLRVGS